MPQRDYAISIFLDDVLDNSLLWCRRSIGLDRMQI